MPVPTYDKIIEPILRYLASRPDGAPAKDVHEAAAALLHVSDLDRQELLPSGIQPVYKTVQGGLMIVSNELDYPVAPGVVTGK